MEITKDMFEWLGSDDTGISSETILCHLTNSNFEGLWMSIPYDASDFGRCYRLIKKCPELKSEFHRMKELKEWVKLVDNWDKLTEMFENKDSDFYEFIKSLR